MTIELQGHVKELRLHSTGKILASIVLEANRGNGQTVELLLTRDEAKTWMPGATVNIRAWPWQEQPPHNEGGGQ